MHGSKGEGIFFKKKGSLDGSQYSHTTDVRVFAVHVVREDDDLEDVRVNRFAKTKNIKKSKSGLTTFTGERRTILRRRRSVPQRRQR